MCAPVPSIYQSMATGVVIHHIIYVEKGSQYFVTKKFLEMGYYFSLF